MRHIDTLYLYRIVKDRGDYYSLLDSLLDTPHDVHGEAGGRQWISLKYCRIGVMDYDKAKRSNQYPFLIQYTWEYLYNISLDKDPELIDFDLPLWGTYSDYKVNRVDFSLTFNNVPLVSHAVSPFRSKALFEKGGKLETVYLGKRNNGIVYRAYDKTAEIKAKESYLKMDYLAGYFGTIEDLTVHELELHRKWFVTRLDDFLDNLNGLGQIYALYLSVVGSIRFFVPTSENLKQFKNRHYDKIDYDYSIIDLLDCPPVNLPKSSDSSTPPSFAYLIKSIEKKIVSYAKRRSDIDIMEIIDRLVVEFEDDTVGGCYQEFGWKYRSKETLIGG